MEQILLVSATITETKAVLPVFESATGQTKLAERINGKTYYRLGSLGYANLTLVESEAGSATPDGSLDTIKDAIRDTHPSTVIMVGIAFGMKRDRQNMCDILVSQYLRAYEPGRVGEPRSLRGVYVNSSSALMDLVRSVQVDWQGPKVHTGLLLSGEKLVDDLQFLKELQTLEPDAVGGEMEGQGLYTAVHKAKLDWMIVKGISDWGNGRKSIKYQPKAAGNAARFVLEMLYRFTPSTGTYKAIPPNPQPAGNGGKPVSSGNIRQVKSILSTLDETFATPHSIYEDECSDAIEMIDQIDAFLNYHWITSPGDFTTLVGFDYIHALINSTRQLLQSFLGTCPPGDAALRKEISALLKEIEEKVSTSLEDALD
jgi:nucleoside phosphorylase